MKNIVYISLLGIFIYITNVEASLDAPASTNGYYTIIFTESTSSNYDFIYKNYDPDTETITDVYYKISYTPTALASDQVRIANNGSGDIVRDFLDIRYLSSSSSTSYDITYGGAINNNSFISSITGDFIKNYNYAYNSELGKGGAIYNYSNINNITGNFVGNYATSINVSAYGGAVYNAGVINSLVGDFIGNYAKGAAFYGYGGAIYNEGYMYDIKADFIGNYASSNNQSKGGAIYNSGTMNVTGDFIGNYVQSSSSYGGAIYNDGGVMSLVGNFIGNAANSTSSGQGGAINNSNAGSISVITGNFIQNYAQERGGAILNYESKIGNITGSFVGNNSLSGGGAIYNGYRASIEYIYGDFIGNFISGSDYYNSGGAIFSNPTATIAGITGNFIGNYIETNNLANGGAVYLSGGTNISGNFIENYVHSTAMEARGGAIYANGTLNILGDTKFIDNYASTDSSATLAQGGAIYVGGNVNFTTENVGQVILFKDNYTVTGAGTPNEIKKLNSIHFHSATSIVNFTLKEDTLADIRDPISGSGTLNKDGGSLYLWGDNSEFTGIININTGSFALMFDEGDTVWSERNSANLSNAAVNFADDTIYRPRVSNTQLASLDSRRTTVGSDVIFLPFDLSALSAGQHIYNNDYYKFDGWSSALASIDTKYNGNSQTEINVRNLAGYQGLSSLADIYRQRSDLSFAEREELDYIYYTGVVSQNILDMFEVLAGDDYINYEQVHRASVRQFNRQVVSRIQNKDCPSCGLEKGYRDQHFWFNVSHNEIEKESSRHGPGYTYDPNGFAFGYDQDFLSGDLNMGLALSYATGEAKTGSVSHGLKNINDVDEYLMSFYGKYRDIRPYISWNTGIGLMRNKTKFQTSSINTRAEYDTYAFFANLETGYDFGTACTKLEPYVGLEYTRLVTESYSERGEGARRFDRMTWNIVEIPVGIRTSHDIYINQYIFTPALDFAYARNVGDANASTMGHFVGNPGQPWRVSSATDNRDTFRSSINFKINNLEHPFAFNFGYGIDYRSDYSDQQFYGTLRWDF